MTSSVKNELIAEMGCLFYDSFEIILDAARLGLWEWNTLTHEVIYIDTNDQLTGYSFSSPFIEKEMLNILIPASELKKVKVLADVFLMDKSSHYEIRFKLRRKDGSLIWCEAMGKTIEYRPDGTPLRVMGIIQDIQAKMSLFKKDEMLKAVNSVACLLMISDSKEFDLAVRKSLEIIAESVDVEHIYLFKNHMQDDKLCCSKICEWPYNENTVYEEILPQPTNSKDSVPYEKYFSGWENHLNAGKYINSLVQDLKSPLKDFPPFQNAISVLVIPIIVQQEFWGFIGFNDFYSERIFSETERDILKSGGLIIASALQRSEMTANLIFAKEIALESTRAKNDFLANMSHEIRTPMNAVMGMTAIAQNSNDMPKVKECLNNINTASVKLIGIVNDLLNMAKLETKQVKLAENEFNFRKMIRSIYNIHLDRLNEKNQKFYVMIDKNVPKWLIGDESRLSQVINNLLGNTIKFTSENGIIKFFAKESFTDGDYSEIEINLEDNGIGMTPEQREKLFLNFAQTAAGKYEGTSLGLPISKNIVEQMGGKLELKSCKDSGFIFSFAVRLKKGSGLPDQKVKASIMPEQFNFSGKHLLLVEDIEINRVIVTALLEATHIAIDTAENGLEAYKMFTASPERYDLIFMDLQMPILNGYEATEKIRSSGLPRSQTIPIIAMTANAFTEDIENCKKAGMNEHLAKPVDLQALLNITSRYTGG